MFADKRQYHTITPPSECSPEIYHKDRAQAYPENKWQSSETEIVSTKIDRCHQVILERVEVIVGW
jgi:hypothetical protein